jgi:lipid A 3-O-deacylase
VRALALVCLCTLVAGCRARRPAPEDGPTQRAASELTFSATVENDLVSGSDNNYTNGVGLSVQTGRLGGNDDEGFLGDWVEFWSFLPGLEEEDCSVYAAWTLGQEMYTPNDIRNPLPQPDDQPYAGILFLDSTLYATTERLTHAWNLRLGMVGPSAHADDVQTWFHELIGAPEPQGWQYQLPDEFIVNVDYTLGGEWLQKDLRGSASCRLVPLGGVSLGNYFTGASAGMYGEIGWNLSPSVGLLSIRRGMDSFATEDPVARGAQSLSLLLGGGGFAVGHFLPLDGTLTEDSPSVDSEPLVGFLSAGLTWRNRWCTLAYLHSDFSQSFEGEIERGAFGTLTISWSF